MRNVLRTTLLAAPAALMALPAAAEIRMTDYDKPDSQFSEAYLTGRFSLNDGNQDQSSYNGALLGDLDHVYSTRSFVWSLDLDASSEFNRGPNDGDSSEHGYSITLGTTFDRYFREDNRWFGFGGLDLGQRQQLGADDADDPYAAASAGIGYGRIINATPLAYAIRIAEELLEIGVLSREPSKATYLRVAAVVDREREYRSRGGSEWATAYLAAIEAAFRSEVGLVKRDRFGAAATIAATRVLFDERVSTRKHGWVARAGLGYVFSNYDGSDSNPALLASFEYALPIGPRLQFGNLTEFSAVLSDDSADLFNNRMSLTWEVSDRVDWENGWNFTALRPDNANATDVNTHELSTAFRYFLNNRLSFDATLALRNVDDDIDDNGNDKTDTSLFIGTTYRLR